MSFFSIGLTKTEVLSKLPATSVTVKTRQFIENFWNNDADGKITNEIELAMLESWASGSEKIKLPVRGKGEKPLAKNVFSDGTTVEYWESLSNKSIIRDLDGNYDRLVLDGHTANWSNTKSSDELVDLDDDGYADYRKYKPDSFSINFFKEDRNLDGNWDNLQKRTTKKNFVVNSKITY